MASTSETGPPTVGPLEVNREHHVQFSEAINQGSLHDPSAQPLTDNPLQPSRHGSHDVTTSSEETAEVHNGAKSDAEASSDPAKLEKQSGGSNPGTPAEEPSSLKRALHQVHLDKLPPQLAWIPGKLAWPTLKPTLRSALVAWICMVIIMIDPAERRLGTASFLILIGSFIQPAELPLVGIIEREFFTMVLLLLSWSYTCIVITISHAARKNPISKTDPNFRATAVFEGEYIEAGPSIVCSVFLSLGTAALLYLKIRFGPSPFLFASILSCILMDISLTYAPLFPYADYTLAEAIILPLACKAAVSIIVSMVFFPKSQNSVFVDAMIAVLKPLEQANRGQIDLLRKSPLEKDFAFDFVSTTVAQAERGLMPLQSASRLLTREVSFGFASGEDLKHLESLVKALVPTADGWAHHLSMIKADLAESHFPRSAVPSRFATPVPSRPGTPGARLSSSHTPQHQAEAGTSGNVGHEAAGASHARRLSHQLQQQLPHFSLPPLRSASPTAYLLSRLQHEEGRRDQSPGEDAGAPSSRRSSHDATNSHRGSLSGPHQPKARRHHLFRHEGPHQHPHASLLERHSAPPVGVWESLRYATVEAHLHQSENNGYTEVFTKLLAESSSPLLEANADSIRCLIGWLNGLNEERIRGIRERFTKKREEVEEVARGRAQMLEEKISNLEKVLHEFRTSRRLWLLMPLEAEFGLIKGGHEAFLDSLDPQNPDLRLRPPGASDDLQGRKKPIPHRYVYQAWVHQFHTISFAEKTLRLLREAERICRDRTRPQLWLPIWPRLLTADVWTTWTDHGSGGGPADEEDDPDTVQGDDSSVRLGQVRPRDPDALEPQSRVEVVGQALHGLISQLFQGNLLYCWKAVVLTALISLPSYLSNTAGWAYKNRAIWVIFMGQLTLMRFRGDTVFGFASRLIATLLGATTAMVLWYISTGSGRGNAYGLGVVTAVAFPFIMLGRLYYPGPPITNIISSVTVALVLGYSWQDTHNASYGSPGFGWDVAWRRFVAVAVGVTAAFIMALLPPSKTLRQHQRRSHATTIALLGHNLCRIITYASHPHEAHENTTLLGEREKTTTKSLIAIRSKLRRLEFFKANVSYEISLRGKFPSARYTELFETQMELSKLLSHLLAVVDRLGPAYSLAFLRRVRFLDPLFLGDCIAVVSMCSTALQTATPLPQITPCPLSQRVMQHELRFDLAAPFREDGYEDALGLPKDITMETLTDEQYMMFAVGVSVAFGIVLRLDRLCIAVKELVGETFAVELDADYMLSEQVYQEKLRNAKRQ